MPRLKDGDIFNELDDLKGAILIPGSSTLTKEGTLAAEHYHVMMAERFFPGFREDYGQMILEHYQSGLETSHPRHRRSAPATSGVMGFYGYLLHPDYRVGLFQTRMHVKKSGGTNLVMDSVGYFLEHFRSNIPYHIVLPLDELFDLDSEEKRALLQRFPHNVTIWQDIYS